MDKKSFIGFSTYIIDNHYYRSDNGLFYIQEILNLIGEDTEGEGGVSKDNIHIVAAKYDRFMYNYGKFYDPEETNIRELYTSLAGGKNHACLVIHGEKVPNLNDLLLRCRYNNITVIRASTSNHEINYHHNNIAIAGDRLKSLNALTRHNWGESYGDGVEENDMLLLINAYGREKHILKGKSISV